VKLGRVNVDAMLRSLTAKQFMEWEYYAQLEPFNELRQDYRVASILQMLANVNRGPNDKPYSLADFLLNFGEQEPKSNQTQSRDQQISVIKAIAMTFAARAKDK